MYLPDYQTIKFEQQERIDKAATVRMAGLTGVGEPNRFKAVLVRSVDAIRSWRVPAPHLTRRIRARRALS